MQGDSLLMMEEKENFELLDHVKFPVDLRELSIEQLSRLCEELRLDIINKVSVNPGHLASSLGAIEITVALHYVFDTARCVLYES